jgi:hypothetical protein
MTQSLAGANKRHQVIEEDHEIVVEKGRGLKLGIEPSDIGSGFVV